MATTTTDAHGAKERRLGDRQYDPIRQAHALTLDLLSHRDTLPREQNGRPTVPSDPRAAHVRHDMQAGKDGSMRRLLGVMQCDLEDGVPLATVLSTLDQMRAYLTLVAGGRAAAPRDLAVLHRAETRAQGRLDLAQLRVAEQPACIDALLEVVRAKNEYDVWFDQYVENIHARLAVLRGSHGVEVVR